MKRKNKKSRLLNRAIFFFCGLLIIAIFGILIYYGVISRKLVILIPFMIAFIACYYLIKILMPIFRTEKLFTMFYNNEIDFDQLNEQAEGWSRLLFKKMKENLNKGYASDILNKQAEINYLQRQINPHFLYNTLESIRGNALVQGETQIAEMTEALATFFRYSISQKGNMVTLDDEIENVKNYFIIQQYRFNSKFSLKYVFDEQNMDLSEYYLPKLTLQPLIENAIYHGLEKKVGVGNIVLKITMTQQRLMMHIIDDGVGIPQEKLNEINHMLISGDNNTQITKDAGIALYNVNKRIKLNFGEKYGLYLMSTVNFGTDVEIVLPLITSKNLHQFEV